MKSPNSSASIFGRTSRHRSAVRVSGMWQAATRRSHWIVYAIVFAALGSVLLFVVHAATVTSITLAPQSGQVTGNASVVTNSTAIGGKALKFGSTGSGSVSTKKPSTISSTTTGDSAKGIITTGDSKANCITIPGGTDGDESPTNLSAAESITGKTYNCLETFANPAPTWSAWEEPWQFSNDDSWSNWLAASSSHQMILGVDLIPQAAPGSVSNPLEWEEQCDAGDYNAYAKQLATYLVSRGAGGIVIRLGIEANGSWEADYVGSSSAEMSDWAKCYDSEVTSMRSVSDAKFLFVWNPNICTQDFPLSDWYPGNAYVDIIGADAYDNDCHYSALTTVSQEGWTAYYTDSASYPGAGFPSLSNIEAFAQANNKPMSFPEWGLSTGGPDDSTYVTDMGKLFNSNDFSFEAYFDTNDDGIEPLGSGIPNATAAYKQEF